MRLRFCSVVLGCAALILSANEMLTSRRGLAQVVSDNSTGTTVIQTNSIYNITGGITVGGRNLFHSFDRFDVPNQGAANFLNDPSVVNIFSRVTGGKVSQIDGVLRSRGSANFFLMNPSGIIFGSNASLDIGGSFVATTANGIQFGDRGTFNTSTAPPSETLTINPSAFLFNQINSNTDITLRGSALEAFDFQNIVLLGGNVRLDAATLQGTSKN